MVSPAIKQFVRNEVRRQLARRRFRHRGLAQEQLAPPGGEGTSDEAKPLPGTHTAESKPLPGYISEARHIDDIFGRQHIKQKICEMGSELKLPSEVMIKLYLVAEGYSWKWTVEDLLDELDKALDGAPPSVNADIIKKKMKIYWGTVPRSSILKGEKGFGTRIQEALRPLYWYEILGIAVGFSTVVVLGYKYLKEKSYEERMRQVGALK